MFPRGVCWLPQINNTAALILSAPKCQLLVNLGGVCCMDEQLACWSFEKYCAKLAFIPIPISIHMGIKRTSLINTMAYW